MPRRFLSNYGKAGEGDLAIIDAELAHLRSEAVVVNLGCGTDATGQLSNLCRALARYSSGSLLWLVDWLAGDQLEDTVWPRRPMVLIAKVNAATATTKLGRRKVDLILALGLFGQLLPQTTSAGTGATAWRTVLVECFRLLRPGGKLIVSNSADRQPPREFERAVRAARFELTLLQQSPAMPGCEEHAGELRYLMVCTKRSKSKKLSAGNARTGSQPKGRRSIPSTI